MKKLLLLLLLTTSTCSFAQQTYVPDDNFEAWLEGSGLGNGIANDDSVTTANVSGLTDLIVSAQGIVDITGIEDFTSLTLIIFNGNPVASADLSQNLALTYAAFDLCDLNSIDVSQNTLLETLLCSSNNLTSLDVSNNTALQVLNCSGNDLTAIDVTQNVALTELSCSQNTLASLNVTQNTVLEELNCVQNSLTTLDVTQNTALTTLDCRSNSLSTIDLSQNPALTAFFCRANALTTLDLSSNPNLHNLNCSVNDLECLNAANGNTFENPSNPGTYSFVCFGNPNLSCIAVSNEAIASANYIADATSSFSTECLSFVDVGVTQSGTLLSADLDSALYQWIDCDNNTSIPGETNQSYTPNTTGNYAVEISVIGDCGSISTDTSTCFLIDYAGLDELLHAEKTLLKIIDLTGRETEFRPNTPLIFIYSDGTRERVMEIE